MTARKILFLDDRTKRLHSAQEKYRDAELLLAANVLEGLRLLASLEFDLVYLDHDLGGEDFVSPLSKTSGMELVRYLEKTAWPPEKPKPHFIIHSSNVFAATAMEARLKKMGFHVSRERWKYEQ